MCYLINYVLLLGPEEGTQASDLKTLKRIMGVKVAVGIFIPGLVENLTEMSPEK